MTPDALCVALLRPEAYPWQSTTVETSRDLPNSLDPVFTALREAGIVLPVIPTGHVS